MRAAALCLLLSAAALGQSDAVKPTPPTKTVPYVMAPGRYGQDWGWLLVYNGHCTYGNSQGAGCNAVGVDDRTELSRYVHQDLQDWQAWRNRLDREGTPYRLDSLFQFTGLDGVVRRIIPDPLTAEPVLQGMTEREALLLLYDSAMRKLQSDHRETMEVVKKPIIPSRCPAQPSGYNPHTKRCEVNLTFKDMPGLRCGPIRRAKKDHRLFCTYAPMGDVWMGAVDYDYRSMGNGDVN